MSSPRGKAKAKARELDEASAGDLEQLTQAFKRIDLRGSGEVRLEELLSVAKDLGIRCSKNTLKKVFREVDPDGRGLINFDQFRIMYSMLSTPEKVKELLSEASAAFIDYRNSVEQDPSFAKHFPMPQSLAPVLRYGNHFHATVETLRWVADGQFLAATSEGKLLIFDSNARADGPLKQCNVGSPLYCADAFPGGPGILVGLGKRSDNCYLWDMGEEQVRQQFAQQGPIVACCLGQEVAFVGSSDGSIGMHDLETGACVATWPLHESHVTSIKIADDGQRVCTTSRDGRVVIFDQNTSSMASCVTAEIPDAAAGYTVCDAAWCSESELLTAGDDYCIKRWDIRRPNDLPLARYMGHTSCVRSLALSPDRQVFASGTNDSSVRLWALNPADTRASLTADGGKATDLLTDLKARRDMVIELVHAGEGDVDEVRELTHEIEHLEATMGKNQFQGDEEIIDVHGNIRAVLGLPGHTLAVGTLAWQSAGNGEHRLVSGAQDEFVHLFEFSNSQVVSGLADMTRQCSSF
ncbi:unnamed protein product [Symbiodinium natans]|uniref:EF-hand domain-containing protein n=1 Tax=Symbiodinium natans TaxID=878477 RepID=A0A812MBV8_9DINO|nr:unnamed protein product [Symbiodinium natans]